MKKNIIKFLLLNSLCINLIYKILFEKYLDNNILYYNICFYKNNIKNLNNINNKIIFFIFYKITEYLFLYYYIIKKLLN